jgi:hypothetical protein
MISVFGVPKVFYEAFRLMMRLFVLSGVKMIDAVQPSEF